MGFKKNILAFFIIGVAGTLLHFVYEWTGENAIIGVFSAINESVWEHNKLIFFPSLIYFTAEYFLCGKKYKNFISASALGIISGIAAITIIFYTYSGILGYSISFVNILIFFIGVAIMLLVRNIILKNNFFSGYTANAISIIIIAIIAILFAVWTFYPPKIAIFIPAFEG